MSRHTRREFLGALGLTPFAIAATASAASSKKKAAPSPIPSATPAPDPLADLRAFRVPVETEPALVFHAKDGGE